MYSKYCEIVSSEAESAPNFGESLSFDNIGYAPVDTCYNLYIISAYKKTSLCVDFPLVSGILQYPVPEAENAYHHSRAEGGISVCH